MSWKTYSHLSPEEWASLSPSQQLTIDPDRVQEEIATDEHHMAMAQAGRPSGQYEFETAPSPRMSTESLPPIDFPSTPQQAQITPSRCASPDVTDEMENNHFNLTEDFVDDDSIEVNDHMARDEYIPPPLPTPPDPDTGSHRLPTNLIGERSKHWFGTHNDLRNIVNDLLLEKCENEPKVIYCLIHREIAPTTGHVHCHSLVILSSPVVAHPCIRLDPRATWEKVKGKLITAYRYVAKDSDKVFEYGKMPESLASALEREEASSRKRSAPTKSEEKWNEMYNRAIVGDQTIRSEQLYARFRAYFDDILASAHTDVIFDGDLKEKNMWIYGPPGTGKTRSIWDSARDNLKTVYVKNCNKWWDGYDGQDFVIIDDAGESIKVLASHLKNWADRYPITAEVKGGTRRINTASFKLFVTSNYSIDELFNSTDAEALKRRFNVVFMDQ